MKRDIEFLFEIGALRHQKRQWQRFLGTNVANITEHHYRVMWLALIIAGREAKGDTAKILKMALVHDIAESRTGDVDYIARQYVDRHEDEALADMLEGTPLKDEFLELWDEYNERKTIEAQIVKDADNLDVDMELREHGAQGNQLGESWKTQRAWVGNNKFYTKTGKQMFKEVWLSDAHDWHINSPKNRLHSGDWKAGNEA